ncbi:MAG TPA: hypothetical protein VGN14_12600 [Candidatus Elarobacter sp.]|jgi:hypothetical protein
MKSVAAALALAGLCAVAAPYDAVRAKGAFALQLGHAQADAFLVSQATGAPPRAHLDLWMTRPGEDTPITAYTVAMTKRIHLIVISDDFRTFLHLHPVLGSDGHFRLDTALPRPARYLVYADAVPEGLNQQVFRFTLDAGGAGAKPRDLTERAATAHVDGYDVSLAQTHVHAFREVALAVRIARSGRPARDLHPYLGALAHAVFVDAGDLSYVHVHAAARDTGMSELPAMSEMPGMNEPPLRDNATIAPSMVLRFALPQRGTYKLWLQFRGGGSLHVAPFVLEAT